MERYAEGNLTVADLAREFGVSTRTIYRRLNHASGHEPPVKEACKVVLHVDTTYWGHRFGVVLIKDSWRGAILWHKFIDGHERIADYKEGIDALIAQGFIIEAIVSDGLKGLRRYYPTFKFQLCQFHQFLTIRKYLTLRPKLEASQELLSLAKLLCQTDKASFVGALAQWHTKWEAFLNERTTNAEGKSHYTHQNLRKAYLSLKNNMPWLWTCYDFPALNIPNTNNVIEGFNSNLKAKINLHKGISRERKKRLILELIIAHKPNK